MSVVFGVSQAIHHRLNAQYFRLGPAAIASSISRIDAILAILTVVVTTAMIVLTMTTTFTVGVVLMRARRNEIAVRRQSGVLRSRLVAEFVLEMLWPAVSGGITGELCAVGFAGLLARVTVLPVRFTPVSLLAAFPTTVVLALMAALVPAYRSAGKSPNILRRES
jgi:ABC-type antimicrobial peptide transport system permease subunit